MRIAVNRKMSDTEIPTTHLNSDASLPGHTGFYSACQDESLGKVKDAVEQACGSRGGWQTSKRNARVGLHEGAR